MDNILCWGAVFFIAVTVKNLTTNYEVDLLAKMRIYQHWASLFPAFSALALLVMSIERYLGAYYPFFHRTSVTRRRLLTLLAIFIILTTVLYIISGKNIENRATVTLTIALVIFLPPFMFFNLKLITIDRKVRRGRTVSPGKRTTINFKTISTALWAVACLGLLYIPNSFYIVLFSIARKIRRERTVSPRKRKMINLKTFLQLYGLFRALAIVHSKQLLHCF